MQNKNELTFSSMVSPEEAYGLFPRFPHVKTNIDKYWRVITGALDNKFRFPSAPWMAYVVGTLRAENESLSCADERPSIANSEKTPFDKYDNRIDLDNMNPKDGEQYRKRGFGQLTGKANYRRYGKKLGLPLVEKPELALVPVNAAAIFAEFLWAEREDILEHLQSGDLAAARRMYNGGTNGLARFTDGYKKTEILLQTKENELIRRAGSKRTPTTKP
jgi:hypothetical protein